ncbi:Fanconi anemia complex, subunit FancL, WD-repeat containing domain containing protein [Parasponia andersonii]|uniref:Fanconi anemia complex, subunit FancL, WD-repeat containing domain containing protein n=1 Tax=Parasponia andersonii TaxID=3476 RepID=A0A2P5E5I9_PARAD|nr:Fanconi anemia complex, subunit FancL, WD-repeat containing domain containing protein [Parasponia andersonii]
MMNRMECGEPTRSKELATSTRFHRLVYSEIEEIGWENLVRLGGDLTFLSLRILDKKGRVHLLEVQLDKTYPKCPPSISADVPYMFDLEWSTHSRLKNVVQQYQEHLEKLQEFWSTLEDIEKTLWVDHKMSSLAVSSRRINIGNDCFIILSINFIDPRSLPE